jgi:hypothetical protein
MKQIIQWTSGLILALAASGSPVSAQQHGNQQMMMPRVPARQDGRSQSPGKPVAPVTGHCRKRQSDL